MKVLSVLALCAFLFFAITYASPISDKEAEAIEQSGGENALTQQISALTDLIRQLRNEVDRQQQNNLDYTRRLLESMQSRFRSQRRQGHQRSQGR